MTPEQLLALLLLVADMRVQIGVQQEQIRQLSEENEELKQAKVEGDD